jgi:hypothetical protein
MIGMFLAGAFSPDLTHHALHTMGSRLYGFTQDVFDDSPTVDAEAQAAMSRELGERYPHIGEMVAVVFTIRRQWSAEGATTNLILSLRWFVALYFRFLKGG